MTGETVLNAAWYRREGGGQGVYPLDIMLGLDESGATREAAFLMANFASECDYEGALVHRSKPLAPVCEALGERARELQGEAPSTPDTPPVARIAIETDGLMTPMRFDPEGDDAEKTKAGWHEAHVGVVAIPADSKPNQPKYRRKDRSPQRKEKTRADGHRDVKLVEASYVATYEGRERHLEKLRIEARRRGLTHATEVALIGDGAGWVQESSEAYFPGALHIVDWHHAAGRLAVASDVAYELNAPCGRVLVRAAGDQALEWRCEPNSCVHIMHDFLV